MADTCQSKAKSLSFHYLQWHEALQGSKDHAKQAKYKLVLNYFLMYLKAIYWMWQWHKVETVKAWAVTDELRWLMPLQLKKCWGTDPGYTSLALPWEATSGRINSQEGQTPPLLQCKSCLLVKPTKWQSDRISRLNHIGNKIRKTLIQVKWQTAVCAYCKVISTALGEHKIEMFSFHIWESVEVGQVPQASFAS